MTTLRRSPTTPERGAVATLVSILLAFGVVVGFAAISVDVGNMMFERRQLQNGADASALALAQICALDVAQCDDELQQTALDPLDNANASDSLHEIRDTYSRGICGHALPSGTGIPECIPPAAATGLVECPPLPAWLAADPAIPYVEVYNETESEGGTILPTQFGAALTGNPGPTVQACSRVAWGAPGKYKSKLPVTVSECEWGEAWAAAGNSYYPGPKYIGTTPDYGYGLGHETPFATQPVEQIFILSYPNNEDPACESWNGHDFPGGFSFLDNANCEVTSEPGFWEPNSEGNVLKDCDPANLLGRVALIPIHECTTKNAVDPDTIPLDCTTATAGANGEKSWYYMKEWKPFYISGYYVQVAGGAEHFGSVTGLDKNQICDKPGAARCIRGWFVEDVVEGEIGGPPDPNGGAMVILPAG